MPFLKTVLVALDFSVVAQDALELAISLSHQYGTDLILCTALDYQSTISAGATPESAYLTLPTVFAEYELTAKALLRNASSHVQAAGARSSTKLLEGRPVPAILAAAKEREVDAIVMGTSGKRDIELMMLGSTADGVLRLADVPTFIVNPFATGAGGSAGFPASKKKIERILVALDDSDPSDAAFDFALSLAADEGSVIFCCSAVATGQLVDGAAICGCDPAPYVQEARDAALARLEAETKRAMPSVHIERIILEGAAPDAIVVAAIERKADIIVCGSHGRRGLRRLMMGSVAESLVRRSTSPVAVVRKASIPDVKKT